MMIIFDFFKKKPVKQMSEFSMLIFNELHYITSYCINQNLDINNCDQDVLAVLSENIGMIYLGAAITYLQHYGLIKERDELIKDIESYTKQLCGRRAPYKEALQKVYDFVKLLDRNLNSDDEEKTIDNWRVWIVKILSRQNKAISPAARLFHAGTLYDERKMTNELLKHITKTRDIIIKAYKEDKEKHGKSFV